MKKRFLPFLSLVLSILIGVTCLSGCRLVTVDNNRDMNQVVATIKVNDREENIYKKDLVMGYLNYGYLYVQYYGYTEEKTYNLLFDEMISSRILAQGAMKEFEEKGRIADSTKNAYELERYVDTLGILNAEYKTYVAINDLLDSAMPTEENKVQDTLVDAVRTVPTNATNKEAEFDKGEKEKYIAKGFDINSSADRRQAFNEVIDLLKENELLGSAYNGTLESTDYFNNSKKNYLETELLAILEETLSLEARQALTFDDLVSEYEEAYENQSEWNNADFVNALTNASVGSPMVYSAFGSYGYVHNVLLGVTEEQTDKISAIRTDNANISDEKYAEKRRDILASTLVSDLRSSWVLSGYDTEVNADGKLIFTGDYTFAKDKNNSLPLQGDYKMIREADAEKKTPALYTVTGLRTYQLDEFVSFMDSYLGGAQNDNLSEYSALGASVYGAKSLDGVSEYKAKINELLFAFSTDDGSLNTYDGYVIKPAVDGANSEEYVKTFGDAGRILLEQGTGYVIVASDFGYHVMFYSESFNIDYSVPTLVEYLNNESGENKSAEEWKSYYENLISDWENFEKEDNYLFHTANNLTSAKVTNSLERIKRDMINTNRYEESDKVVLYKNLFEDLYK